MKTIQELNNKMWYRFVKVIYIFFSITIIIGIFITVFIDGTESRSDCQINTFKSKVISRNEVKKIIDGRPEGVEPIDIFTELENNGYIMEGYNDISISNSLPQSQDNGFPCKNIFSLNYPNWLHTIFIVFYSVVCGLLTVGVLELFRRIFYYIIFGKFFPSKN